MTPLDNRPPEDWEAGEHIENLKRGVPAPGQTIKGICDYHPSMAMALIWIIRRLDTERDTGWVRVAMALVRTGPVGLLGIGLLGIAIVWAKSAGIW